MKRLIGILLALTMLLGVCPSMLAADNDVTWFEPVMLSVDRFVVDNSGNKLVLKNKNTNGFPVEDLSKLNGTKIKGSYTYRNAEEAVNIDVQVTGNTTASSGNVILLFDNPGDIITGYPSEYSLKLYPSSAEKATKHNFEPFVLKVSTTGRASGRIRLVSAANQDFPVDITSANALAGCQIRGTAVRSNDATEQYKDVLFDDITITGSSYREDGRTNIEFDPTDAVNSTTLQTGNTSNYTFNLTIYPAPYNADTYASYVAAEGTASAAEPLDTSHVKTGGSISGVINAGAEENTISTGFIAELPSGAGDTLHWEIRLPASGSYVKLADGEDNALTGWIEMDTGDAVINGSDGTIRPINKFVVSGDDKNYITVEFNRNVNSTTITTDEGSVTVCGIIINNIYAPSAKAAVE